LCIDFPYRYSIDLALFIENTILSCVVGHTYNPSTLEIERRGSGVPGQPRLHNETLPQNNNKITGQKKSPSFLPLY
jgi:hypothetical protein